VTSFRFRESLVLFFSLTTFVYLFFPLLTRLFLLSPPFSPSVWKTRLQACIVPRIRVAFCHPALNLRSFSVGHASLLALTNFFSRLSLLSYFPFLVLCCFMRYSRTFYGNSPFCPTPPASKNPPPPSHPLFPGYLSLTPLLLEVNEVKDF